MTLSAVLMAGGLSRRMGTDKATLLIDGLPLWSRQLSILRMLEPAALFISARTVPSWAPPDVHVVLDVPPARGPLSGIAVALQAMQTTHLLALAVDLPRMTAEHLKNLKRIAGPSAGVIPRNADYFEPLAAIYPKAAAPHATGALRSGDASLQSLARELLECGLLQTHVLSSAERSLYENLNSL